MKPVYFRSPADFSDWLDRHGSTVPELMVGLYRKESGRETITYPEAVDVALCFGWIDGVRRCVDQHSYCIRFTPRKARSIWSKINIKRAENLRNLGLMRPAGLKVFEARSHERSGIYSFENAPRELEPVYQRELQRDKRAWAYFQSRPPWYQRTASFWVMSAKKAETRHHRLAILIADSAKGRTIKPLTRPAR